MKKERLSLTSVWKKLKPYVMQKIPMVTLITGRLTRIKIRIQYILSEVHKVWIVLGRLYQAIKYKVYKVWIVLRWLFPIIKYAYHIYDLLVLIGYIPPM